MKTRLASDRVLVQRLLPSTNADPGDRAAAWRDWCDCGGRAAVLSFVRVTNDTNVPDVEILQDAIATAYLEIERGRYQPRPGVPLAAYVKGIARNKIREARRRARRLVPLGDDLQQTLSDRQPPPETVVESREQARFLHQGLAKLPSQRRRVVEGYLNGHTTAEIAESLGISRDLVRQHKSRAVRRLRRLARTTRDR